MKAKYGVSIFVALLAIGTALPAYANPSGGCPMQGRGKGEHGSWGKQNVEGLFFHKAHFLLKSQEQLGLSDEQVKAIKDLKVETKKNDIRQDAEIKALDMDIFSKLGEEKIDTAAVQKLIDQKYDAKKATAQSFVDAYAKLMNTLNDKQREALKALKKEKMKDYGDHKE